MDETDNIRYAAVNYAIKSACGTQQSDNGFVTTDANKLIEAAKIFEAYLRGNDNAQN